MRGCRVRRIWLIAGLVPAVAIAGVLGLHFHNTRYDEIISQSASRYEVSFYLVKAIIYEESWFRRDSLGAAGELGLMQVTMRAAADYSSRNRIPPINEPRLLEPRLNIEVGCWYLRQSLDRYKDSPDPTLFALLRYNAGEVRADAWLRQALSQPAPAGRSPELYYLSLVDFPTTREYVSRILKRSRSRNYWF